jgi:hypothetical protein
MRRKRAEIPAWKKLTIAGTIVLFLAIVFLVLLDGIIASGNP